MREQPANLIRFIASLDIKPNNVVYLNGLDMKFDFVSRFYTPHISISVLANNVLRDIATGMVPTTVLQNTEYGILRDIEESGIKTINRSMYTLIRIVLLETFSIVYTLNDKQNFIRYVEIDAIDDLRQNIKYLIDALGKDNRYSKITQSLQILLTDLGYIQAAIPEMKERWRIDGTL